MIEMDDPKKDEVPEEVVAYYKDKFNMRVPELRIGLTRVGISQAVAHLLYEHNLVPQGKVIEGLIVPVEDEIAIAAWFEDAEPEEDDFAELDAGVPRILN